MDLGQISNMVRLLKTETSSELETVDNPILVCTGDLLFIGDTGRTDFGGTENIDKWSTWMYESIHEKILPLGNHVILCPAHGSGSVCGAKIASREYSTLGAERIMNPQLKFSKEEFMQYKKNERHNYAPYFKRMEILNVEGAPEYGLGPNVQALSAGEFERYIKNGALVMDVRPPPSFSSGYIKGSYNVSVDRLGMAGWVLSYDKPILLILGNKSELRETVTGLGRMGYDNVLGYMTPSIVSWYLTARPVERLSTMTAPELKARLETEKWTVLDVRSAEEYDSGHIKGSLNIYVGTIPERLNDILQDKPIAVICKSGTRSGFGCSILVKNGITNVTNIMGGMTSWINANYPTVKDL
jgi:hydroxyacylglutathione hydrolase